jgi:hypothetical protein
MSAKAARPSHSQSKSTTPAGEMMTYMSVVHGKKIKPNIGQIMELKAAFQRIGWKIHQRIPATRVPRNTRVVNKQHILDSPWIIPVEYLGLS